MVVRVLHSKVTAIVRVLQGFDAALGAFDIPPPLFHPDRPYARLPAWTIREAASFPFWARRFPHHSTHYYRR